MTSLARPERVPADSCYRYAPMVWRVGLRVGVDARWFGRSGLALMYAALAGCLWTGQARAQAVALRVEGRCPTAVDVEAALGPLLEGGAAAPSADGGGPSSAASVVDGGVHYRVSIGQAARTIEDASRDCPQRARVAAVFIALNHVPRPAETRASAPPEVAPSPDPGGRVLWGLAGFAGVGLHGPGEPALGAGGVGVWLAHGPWRWDLELGASTPVSVGQAPVNAPSPVPRATLLRLPVSLEAAYLLRAGAVSFGPLLGGSFEVFHLRVGELEGAPAPKGQLRVSPAVRFGLRLQLAPSERWHVSLRVGGQVFPRPYRLSLDPEVALGNTPNGLGFLWLGGGFAVP